MKTFQRIMVGLSVGVVLSSCIPHPVGPARTFSKYEGKARTTAEASLSAVQSAKIAAKAALKRHTFGPYLSVTLSDLEETTSGVQGTFDSIQPPNSKSDELRSELDELLSQANDDVSTLRIAVRRADYSAISKTVESLIKDANDLNKFVEEHK